MINEQISVNRKQSALCNSENRLPHLNAFSVKMWQSSPWYFSSSVSHYFGSWKTCSGLVFRGGLRWGVWWHLFIRKWRKCHYMKYWWHASEHSEVPVTIDQVCRGDKMVCISSSLMFNYSQSYTILLWQWGPTDFNWSRDSAITHKCHFTLWIHIEMCTFLSKHVIGHYQKPFTIFTYIHKFKQKHQLLRALHFFLLIFFYSCANV